MRYGLIALASLASLLSSPADADYLYTVSYDAQTINARTYPADSFSFLVSSILLRSNQGGDIVSVPGGELNGFTFTSILWGGEATFEAFPQLPISDGEVAALAFYLSSYPDAVGTYDTGQAGRGIGFMGGQGVQYAYGTGSLSIREVSSATPEPESWMLVFFVLGPVLLARRVHRRRLSRG